MIEEAYFWISEMNIDKHGIEIQLLTLKRGEVADVVVNKTCSKLTQLQDTFGMNLVALKLRVNQTF